jgi:hypothetical protein
LPSCQNNILYIFRKLYIFKIIPFLNPDGVANGLYRSDTLGHNLNRVYLTPRLDRHPSIYAVRKLIRYYHYGCEKPDNGDELKEIATGVENSGAGLDDKDSIELSSLINELKEDGDEDIVMSIDKGKKLIFF